MPVFRKHKNPCLAAVITVAVTLTGCATHRADPPLWLENPASAAPVAGWWMAAAEGRTRAEAIDAAMIALAQRVESRVTASEYFTETTAGTHLDRTGSIHTNVALVGAEVIAAAHHCRTNTPPSSGSIRTLPPKTCAHASLLRSTQNHRKLQSKSQIGSSKARSSHPAPPIGIHCAHA